MNGMSIGRRRLLLALAAGGAAGACGFFSKAGLAQLALAGTRATPRLKVIFFVSPDGLGVDEFNVTGEDWNGNGIWHPTSTMDISKDFDISDFELNEASNVLEPYRATSVYLRGGITNFQAGDMAFGGHNAYHTILRNQAANQTSIDNLLVAHFQLDDPGKPLLYAGPHTQVGNPWHVSWIGENAMLTPTYDPAVLYADVFGRSPGRGRGAQPFSARIFKPVLADLHAVRDLVQGSERAKFETHIESALQVQKDIEAGIGDLPTCEAIPPDMTGLNVASATDRLTVTERHMDVVVAALGCGRRRVATVQIGASTESLNFPDIKTTRNPHDLAHWGLFGGGAESTRSEWVESRRWYVKRLAYLLDKLATHADPDTPGESLAEHTLVIMTSEMADGYKEHMMDMPLVFIGGKGTPLITNPAGRYLSVAEQGEVSWNGTRPPKALGTQRVWSSLAQAVGTTVPYPGNNELVPGLFKPV